MAVLASTPPTELCSNKYLTNTVGISFMVRIKNNFWSVLSSDL